MRRPAKFAAGKFAAVLTAAAVMAAGCGDGTSRANAAAIIDGRTISVDDVQSRVEKVVKDNPFAQQLQQQHKLDMLSRSILSREVRYELLGKAAGRENLAVQDDELNQRVAQVSQPPRLEAQDIEGNLKFATDSAFDAREVARNELLAEALGQKYLEKLSVTFDGALIGGGEAKRQAQDLARKLADNPGNAGALLQELGQGDGTGQAQAQGIPNETLSMVTGLLIASQSGFELASSALYTAPQNTVVAFSLASQVTEQGGGAANTWFVALIKQRNQNASLSEQERAGLAGISPAFYLKIGNRLASQYLGEVKLDISPRYGVWDPIGNTIAPRPEEVAGYQYPARATKP